MVYIVCLTAFRHLKMVIMFSAFIITNGFIQGSLNLRLVCICTLQVLGNIDNNLQDALLDRDVGALRQVW